MVDGTINQFSLLFISSRILPNMRGNIHSFGIVLVWNRNIINLNIIQIVEL